MSWIRRSGWTALLALGAPRRPHNRAAVEAVHDRTVSRHHVDEWRLVLRRRVAHPVLVEQDGVWNVCAIPVTGGEWTRITRSTTDSTYAVFFFPKDDRILFTRDQGGNEFNHP